MKDISYYYKDAIESRMSTRQSVGHDVTQYERHTEYGVVKIYYHIDITKKMAVLSGLLVIPGLFYLADQAVNDGDLCTHKETHYFDANSGQEISFIQAQENKNKNKQADLLNREGNELYKQGKYEEAYNKFDQAYQKCTIGYSEEARFKSNRDIAKNNWAEELNKQGLELWNNGDYAGATDKFNTAYQKCINSYKNEQAFKDNRDKAQIEVDAIKLNVQGDDLFNQGKYGEAQSKYQAAYDKSQVSNQYNKYSASREKAKIEIEAINLNSQGDILFNQGKYNEAQSKYQAAYDKSQVSNQYNKYSASREKAKIEIEAINLNYQGDILFNQGKYNEAQSKYQEAYDKSQIPSQRNKYKSSSEIIQAKIYNKEGYQLLGEACSEVDINVKIIKYKNAQEKFEKAINICPNNDIYKNNLTKTLNSIDALNCNSEGDKLFEQGKYKAALDKYQAAYDKYQITKEKIIYALNRDKAQTIIDLDKLWNKSWDAENDDRPEEAKELFQEVLDKVKDGLKIFPNNLKFQQYETLVSLKIEGNELFNQGIESQQHGVKLLQEAKELQQKQKYELANIKFNESQVKFNEAKEKFTIGSKSDQRFTPCIEVVQEQIEEVIQSIKITEPYTLNQRLNDLNPDISNYSHLEEVCYEFNTESNITGNQNDYYKQVL